MGQFRKSGSPQGRVRGRQVPLASDSPGHAPGFSFMGVCAMPDDYDFDDYFSFSALAAGICLIGACVVIAALAFS